MVLLRLMGDERGTGEILNELKVAMEEFELPLKIIDKKSYQRCRTNVFEAFAESAAG